METVLIDTSAWIVSFSSAGFSNVKLFINELIRTDRAVTTGMVRLELLQGAVSDRHATILSNTFRTLTNLEADNGIWEEVGALYRKLRSKGLTVAIPDLWIATLALKERLVLLHADKDFERIARLTELKTLIITS